MANEKRLIDANATLQGIESFMQCYAEKEKELTPFWVKVAIQALDMVRQFIKKLPTVDAVEVVHGRWMPFIEDVKIYNAGGFTEKRQTGWVCSKCGKGFTKFGHQKYCGDCGAKMDGD